MFCPVIVDNQLVIEELEDVNFKPNGYSLVCPACFTNETAASATLYLLFKESRYMWFCYNCGCNLILEF